MLLRSTGPLAGRAPQHRPPLSSAVARRASYDPEDPIDISDQATPRGRVLAGGIDTVPAGEETPSPRWYSFGPRPNLLGRRVANLPGRARESELGPAQPPRPAAPVEVAEVGEVFRRSSGRVNGTAPTAPGWR